MVRAGGRAEREAAGRGVVAQPRAAAGGAGDLADQMIQPLPVAGLTRDASSTAGNRPLYWKRTSAGRSAASSSSGIDVQRNPRLAGAVQDGVLLGRRQLLERHVEREAGVARERLGEAQERAALGQVRPGGHGAVAQRQLRVADEQGRVGALLHAQPFAGRAPAERAVERKMVRIERLEAAAAVVAGEMLAEAVDPPVRLRLLVVRR